MNNFRFTRKFSILFLLCILLINCLNLSFTQATTQDFQSGSLVKNTLSIVDFDDFELIVDNEFIMSTRSSSELSFKYEGLTSEWVTERYICTFDSNGNCSDISIQVNLEYSLNDVNDHFQSGIEVGSYYNSSGDFVGPPPDSPDRIRSIAYVYDAWDASQATYASSLWGYGTTIEYLATTNAAGLSGNTTVFQQRINQNTTCSLRNPSDNSDYFSHTWNNQNHKINYLLLYINSRQTYSNVSAIFTSISANLSFSEIDDPSIEPSESPTGIFNGLTYLVSFSGIMITAFLFTRKKKS